MSSCPGGASALERYRLELNASIATVHERLFHTIHPANVNSFVSDERFVGPFVATCGLTDGYGGLLPLATSTHGGWPAEGSRAGVGLRSLSKMVAAATYLALVEHGEGGLKLESQLGEIVPECAGTALASTTAIQAMSMDTALDNRLSAAWAVSQGMEDHAAFPPECDALGLSALDCVVQLVCPRYGSEKKSDDVATCEDSRLQCREWSAQGECAKNPTFMIDSCSVSCGVCDPSVPQTIADLGRHAWWSVHTTSCGDVHSETNCSDWARQGECEANSAFMHMECPASCGVCDRTVDGVRRARLERTHKCRYDNYAYTLLDAMVIRRTGRPLWRWGVTHIAEPLRMDDMLRCMVGGDGTRERFTRASMKRGASTSGVSGCFALPRTPNETLHPSTWRLWRGGPESVAWPSNGMFGSASDLVRFGAMLASGGILEGKRVLSNTSVRLMLSKTNLDVLECQGMDSFGLGIGNCADPDASRGRCSAHEWWGWGSTYGHRFALLPAVRRPTSSNNGAQISPSLVCATFNHLATSHQPKDGRGLAVRLGSRQHTWAHLQAAALRHLLPLLPRAEEEADVRRFRTHRSHKLERRPIASSPLERGVSQRSQGQKQELVWEWLLRQHNLSAAIEVLNE